MLNMCLKKNKVEEPSVSQGDLIFLIKMKEGIKQSRMPDEMPLPFKGKRPKLPNNTLECGATSKQPQMQI